MNFCIFIVWLCGASFIAIHRNHTRPTGGGDARHLAFLKFKHHPCPASGWLIATRPDILILADVCFMTVNLTRCITIQFKRTHRGPGSGLGHIWKRFDTLLWPAGRTRLRRLFCGAVSSNHPDSLSADVILGHTAINLMASDISERRKTNQHLRWAEWDGNATHEWTAIWNVCAGGARSD